MQIQLPGKVSYIISVLNEAGYEAYAVGGCVRDCLLGRTPGDWDITTSALPEQVKSLFRRTVDTGIQHGTVTVMIGDDGFEITTYRLDSNYSDGRHPDHVSFTPNLSEDLKRRDFTINAMAYHPEKGIVDLFGGMSDLSNRIIRAVGDPYLRFEEDALRIMRAIRFSAQLGFTIEEKTFRAIRHFAARLKLVSNERIQIELSKLLVSSHPEYFELFYTSGITRIIFPLFDEMMDMPQRSPYHCYTVGRHTLKVLRNTPPELHLRLTALFHDTGKVAARTTDETGRDHFYGHAIISTDIAHDLLRELRYDNQTVQTVCQLIKYHDQRIDPTPQNVRRAMNRIGCDLFPDYLTMMRADAKGKTPDAMQESLVLIQKIDDLFHEITAENQCVTLKDLAVSGRDLIREGIHPGKEIGALLERMLQDVLEVPEHNDREYLLNTFVRQ